MPKRNKTRYRKSNIPVNNSVKGKRKNHEKKTIDGGYFFNAVSKYHS